MMSGHFLMKIATSLLNRATFSGVSSSPLDLGLIMVKSCIRGIYYQFSQSTDFYAVINIIKGHRQLRAQTTHLVKDGFLCHETGRRDGAVVLGAHALLK